MRCSTARSAAAVLLLLSPPVVCLPGADLPTENTWWTKRITADIHTTGLLSEEDIIALKNAGFRSILSVWNLPHSLSGNVPGQSLVDAWGTAGVFRLSAAERQYVESLGLRYEHIEPWCPPTRDSGGFTVCDEAVLNRISNFITSAPKPIAIHCQISRLATGAARWHLYRSGAFDAGQFFATSQVTPGWDYTRYLNYHAMWERMTGYAAEGADRPAAGTLHPRLLDFRPAWKTQKVTDGIYIAGRLPSALIPTLRRRSGFAAVVSLLPEAEGGTAMESAVTTAGMIFAHVPVPWPLPDDFGKAEWAAVARQLREVLAAVTSDKAVVFYDDTGARSMVAAVLLEAEQEGHDALWCVDTALRANHYRFPTDDPDRQPYKLFLGVAGGGAAARSTDDSGYAAAGVAVAAALVVFTSVALRSWQLRRAQTAASPPPPIQAQPTMVRASQDAGVLLESKVVEAVREGTGTAVEKEMEDKVVLEEQPKGNGSPGPSPYASGRDRATWRDIDQEGRCRLLQAIAALAVLLALSLLCYFLGDDDDAVAPRSGAGNGTGQGPWVAGGGGGVDGDGSSQWPVRRLLQVGGTTSGSGGWRSLLLLYCGVLLGAVLDRSDFSFTGANRRILSEGFSSARGVREQRAVCLMFILVSLLYLPLLVVPGTALNGAPALGWVNPIGLPLAVGAAVFGVGQQLGGGCGSGCVQNAGTGSARGLVVLICFVFGSLLGGMAWDWWKDWPESDGFSWLTDMPRGAGALIHFALLIAAWTALAVLQPDDPPEFCGTPPKDATQDNPLRQYRLLRCRGDDGGLLPRPLHHVLFAPLSLTQGAVGLSVGNLLVMLVRNQPWGVTFAFSEWGANLLDAMGADIRGDFDYYRNLRSNVFASDGTTPIVFGMLVGTALSAIVSRNAFGLGEVSGVPALAWVGNVLGGLLLGFGARLARGCNIGALTSGMASFSAAPWVWLAANLAGNLAGVKLRSVFQM